MSLQFDRSLQILLTIDKVFYHDLKGNIKDLAQSGLLILYTGKIKDKEILSIRIGHLIMNLIDDLVIVKCQYESMVIYYLVVVNQDLVSSITFNKSHEERAKFENYLRNHCRTLEMEDLENNVQVKDAIERNWSGFSTHPVINLDKVQEFISSAGTTMEKGIIKLSMKIRDYAEKRKNNQDAPNPRNIEVEPQPQYNEHIDEGNSGIQQPPVEGPEPSKFKKFLSAVNVGLKKTAKVISKVSAPIIRKGRQLNDRICYKIDQSESKALKYMKDLAAVSNDAISNAYSGIKTGVTNKELLYVTFMSKDVVLENPQLEEKQEQEPESPLMESSEQTTPVDVTNRGLKDSLLNKEPFEESLNTPYEERI